MSNKITHSELVELSRLWLKRQGYPIVVTEIACVGEEPDAIGFKNGHSCLVECKASRSDFLADKKKVWRMLPDSLGDVRYYCAPKDMIKPDELQEGWGLLEAGYEGLRKCCSATPVTNKGCRNELYLLMSVIRRIGQTEPKGVSIKCYTYETKNRASITIKKEEQ